MSLENIYLKYHFQNEQDAHVREQSRICGIRNAFTSLIHLSRNYVTDTKNSLFKKRSADSNSLSKSIFCRNFQVRTASRKVSLNIAYARSKGC